MLQEKREQVRHDRRKEWKREKGERCERERNEEEVVL